MITNLYDEINRVLNPLETITEANFKLDSAIHRFDITKKGDNAGWVIGSGWTHKTIDYFTATYGSWRRGEKFTWTSWDPNTAEKSLKDSMKRNTQLAKAALEKEQLEKYEACRKKWQPVFYSQPTNVDTHEYLVKKLINSNYSARVDTWGNLLIPIFNLDEEEAVRFVGVQRIIKQKEDGAGFDKRFSAGVELKGSFFAFGDIKSSEHIYLAEGFATGASIQMATRKNVAICFNAGNIERTILTLRKIKPGIKITICADRDINDNPRLHDIGFKKAKWAARKYSNCIVKKVKFEEGEDQPEYSDFNDLHYARDLKSVQEQLYFNESDFIDIAFLGHHDKRYYYFIKNKKMLLGLTPAEHTKTQLLMMAPAKYWRDNYGYRMDKQGEMIPDWDRAIEKIAIIQGEKGFFNPEAVRGVGCWLDDDRLFVNLGDKILINKDDKEIETLPIFDDMIKTKNFYEGGLGVKVDIDKVLTAEQGQQIIDAFKMLKFKNPSDHTYLTGWLAMSQIFGAIDWRPHLWLTGERGTGKTTILEFIDKMLPMSLSVTDSTASGIKQTVRSDTRPVIYDESEPDSDKMKPVIQLARQSSSRTNSKVLRGTISGKALQYNTNVVFCFGSIQKQLFSAADESRVFIIEMQSLVGQDKAAFSELENAMSEIEELARPLFMRMITNFHRFKRSFVIARETIKEKKVEARQADQLATILAAYFVLGADIEITPAWVHRKVEELNFMNSDYMEANKENDSEKCLETILQISTDEKDKSTIGTSIQLIIYGETRHNRDEEEKKLAYLGIKFDRTEKTLFVAANNIYLKEKLRRYSEYTDYCALLKRHSRYIKYGTKYIDGRNVKGVTVKLYESDKEIKKEEPPKND